MPGYRSNNRVTAIDAKFRPRHVRRSVRQQEGNGAHQVLRETHPLHGRAADPLLLKVGPFGQDLLGPAVG